MSNKLLIIVLIVSCLFVRFAEAHAFLDHADPKVGSTIHDPPSQVTVWMTENLEPAFSRLQVFDANGIEVDKKDTRVNGATMAVSLQKLPAAPIMYPGRQSPPIRTEHLERSILRSSSVDRRKTINPAPSLRFRA